MAGIGADAVQPLGINPNQYLAQAVQPMESVVNPSAIAALSEAFRSGQVSADDIISRYGEVAKTKDKATIQGLHEFISPEAIQARKDILSAEGGAARLKGAQFEAALPSVRRAQQVADAELDARFADANLHPDNYDAKVKAILSVGGHTPRIDPAVGITDTQKDEIDKEFELAALYRHETKMAADLWASFKPRQQELVERDAAGNETKKTKEIIDSAFGPVDMKTRFRTGAYAGKSFARFKENPISFLDEVFGGAGGGKNKATAAVTPAAVQPAAAATAPATPELTPEGRVVNRLTPTVTEAAAQPAAAAPASPASTTPGVGEYDAEGNLITGISAPKAPPASEITEKEKLYAQITSADEFKTKLDRARDQIHDAVIKSVGPGYDEGSRFAKFKTGIGAFLGIPESRLKFQTQDELQQFLAQHVQATIRSMAGTGNRVMQAEIKNDSAPDAHGYKSTGLFYQAAPSLTSTPETWDKWLNDMETLFQNARNSAVEGLPSDERSKYTAPLGTSGTHATRFRPGTSGNTGFKPEVTVKGGFKLKLDPATNTYK